MNWLKQILSRCRFYNELADEIREHLEEKIEELAATGMSRKEATAAARREFGNLTLIENACCEVWQYRRPPRDRGSGSRPPLHRREAAPRASQRSIGTGPHDCRPLQHFWRAGTNARLPRTLWHDVLSRLAPHQRDRDSHGARSAARKCSLDADERVSLPADLRALRGRAPRAHRNPLDCEPAL